MSVFEALFLRKIPPEAYYKRNYVKITVDLVANQPAPVTQTGDFLDVIDSTIPLDQVLISINDGDWLRLSDAVPVTTFFSRITLLSSQSGRVTLLIGAELWRSEKQNVRIVSDLVGLAKDSTLRSLLDVALSTRASEATLKSIDSKLTVPSSLKTARVLFDNSTGATSKTFNLFTTSTPSKYATIYYPVKLVLDDFTSVDQSAAPAILIGDSSGQQKTMYPGDRIETSISDLSVVVIKVPAGAKIYLEVVWEV